MHDGQENIYFDIHFNLKRVNLPEINMQVCLEEALK